MKYTRSIKKEFGVPLNKVQRWWIRVPATILVYPVALIVCLFWGVYLGIKESVGFLVECVRGPKKVSRCCGRCDGVHDECIVDQVCEKHNEMGCEICWPRFKYEE